MGYGFGREPVVAFGNPNLAIGRLVPALGKARQNQLWIEPITATPPTARVEFRSSLGRAVCHEPSCSWRVCRGSPRDCVSRRTAASGTRYDLPTEIAGRSPFWIIR